jgi:hypothetical protein
MSRNTKTQFIRWHSSRVVAKDPKKVNKSVKNLVVLGGAGIWDHLSRRKTGIG